MKNNNVRMFIAFALGIIVGFMMFAFMPGLVHANYHCYECWQSPTPSPTATPEPTETPTPSPTSTPEPTINPCQLEQDSWKEEPVATPCPTETPVPTATPTPEPQQPQGDSFSAPGHPECTATPPTLTMANFHAFRKGGDAILKWLPTEGNKANIYYKQNTSAVWQYSKMDIDNNGYTEIHDLGGLDITFAGQQANDCSGGVLTTAVIDGAEKAEKGWILFR